MSSAAQAVSYLHEVASEPAERASSSFEVRGPRGQRLWSAPRGQVRAITRPRLVESPRASEASQWADYLADLERATGITERHAGAVRETWTQLREAAGASLRIPAAGPGGELGFFFSWNYADVYVAVDIAADGRLEWFWKDVASGARGGSEEEELTYQPPEGLIAILVSRCLRR